MRSDDFTRAPLLAQANAMVVVETAHGGVGRWLRGLWRHRRLVRMMRRTDGYLEHRIYWRPRWTTGAMAWFATVDDVRRFATRSGHPPLVSWARDTGRVAERDVKVYQAAPHGYTNGVWRAEGDVFGLIERFSPVRDEVEGPPVRPPQGRLSKDATP